MVLSRIPFHRSFHTATLKYLSCLPNENINKSLSKRLFINILYVKCIEIVGAAILFVGVLIASINMMILWYNNIKGTKIPMFLDGDESVLSNKKSDLPPTFGQIRKQLGEITALGLEVLVVSDVMETLTKHEGDYSWDSLGKLAAIAAFRTLLAYALGSEIREIEEKELKFAKHLAKV